MRGLDTNVLVRYIVKDDHRQAEKASAYIRGVTERGEDCFINHIVLCELVWVLEAAYGFSKKEIAGVLERYLLRGSLRSNGKMCRGRLYAIMPWGRAISRITLSAGLTMRTDATGRLLLTGH